MLAIGASVVTILLLLASCLSTGTPYLAVGILVSIVALVWACLEPKRLIYLLVAYCCIYPFLISDLGLPRFLSYGGDFINIVAFAFSLRSGRLWSVHGGWARIPFIMFCVVALLSAIGNGVSPLLFFWEARNVFRFFIFLIACVGLLDVTDLHRIIRLLFMAFAINLILCSFESLVLHYGQDNTNGLFGSGSGGNAATNVLLIEMTCVALFGYGRKKIGLPLLIFTILGSCWISIISELKFYFIQLAILVILYVVVEKPSVKNILLVLALFMCLYAAIQAFYLFMPEWSGYFTIENLIESSSTGSYGGAQMNRLTAIETIRKMFIADTIHELFGLGFGAGTYSQFFSSPLYAEWGEILHWNWFTDAQIYLETGLIGLFCYAAFFGLLGINSLRRSRSLPGKEAYLAESGSIMALLCVLLMFYNCVLTVDPGGYLTFIFLAMPLIVQRDQCSKEVG